jgi:FkbH-like protein
VLATHPSIADRVIDAVIESPAACMRERVLLQAVDWRAVDPTKVERLLEALSAESVRLPGWLAKALVVGGHALPATYQGGLDAPLNALNGLNKLEAANATDSDSAIEAWGSYLALIEDLDPEIAAAGVRRLASLSKGEAAARLAIAHWVRAPQLVSEIQDDIDALSGGLPEARIRLTGFSTTHGIAVDLGRAFAACGYRASVSEAEYGQVLAELMQPSTESRDALMILLDLEGLHAPEWRQDASAGYGLLQQKLDLLTAGLEGYAGKGLGPILVNTMPVAAVPTAGLIDTHHPAGLAHAVQMINGRLADVARTHAQTVLVDTNRALSGLQSRRWVDPKLWYYGRLPFSPDATRHLALAFANAYRALKRGTAKVLALDLDNTLWGGVYGEDGVAKLLCDDEFPGNAFKAFQRECLRLKSQGILLALLSKNNPDAITAFSTHPGMLLKEDDFVATRINWEPKPGNIRNIAEELNLGLDSFVFIDDSPHEREAMRRMCPELTVPELPADPASRPLWLRALAVTWPTRLTEEDSRRSDRYLAEKRRAGLRESAVSFQDYLGGLDQTLIVRPASAEAVGRVAQMHLRTNQFNLTTERYDEAAIKGMVDDPRGYVVLHGQALDKFGDHGIVVCATARIDGDTATLQSFLMSCRVVGRAIETAFLGALLERLAERGVRTVRAAYIPTKKNALVRDFYKTAGFSALAPEGDTEHWLWEMGSAGLPGADLISVRWET